VNPFSPGEKAAVVTGASRDIGSESQKALFGGSGGNLIVVAATQNTWSMRRRTYKTSRVGTIST
jgi:short-subunit dehydrogenase